MCFRKSKVLSSFAETSYAHSLRHRQRLTQAGRHAQPGAGRERQSLARHRFGLLNIGGYRELQEQWNGFGSFRLLLGAEPTEGAQVGLPIRQRRLPYLLRADLEQAPFNEATLRLVEDLIAFLHKPHVFVRLYERGFLHAKCYLFYGDHGSQMPLLDRFEPLVGIVGSSNFTAAGLRTNRELNLSHKTLLDPEDAEEQTGRLAVESLVKSKVSTSISPVNQRILKSEVGATAILELVAWYNQQWDDARDFKADLIDLLNRSKFGGQDYTPYEVYLKAIYEYFRDDLGDDQPQGTRSAVELAEFQEDAVKKARRILARYDGVLIGDSVGMGKTWIGKKLLEDFAYHQRMKAIVICPASLRDMWQHELAGATIAAQIVSQESLGQLNGNFNPQDYADADVVLIDESHNFRNRSAQRYQNLELLLAANGRRGRSGGRKKVILLTATPINNDIFDLYNQIVLFTGNDRAYFAGAGIGDIFRFFVNARRKENVGESSAALFNLLEEVVIRRTRPFIRKAYPNATINGQPVKWPERKLHTIRYDLEATYAGIYDEIVSGIESLTLAHYNLESYKKTSLKRDELEEGREQALVGIFKTRYLKRFESSIEAFRISIRRALAYIKTYEEYLLDGKVLDSRTFEKAMRTLAPEDEEDDATPDSLAEEFDASEEARELLAQLPQLNPADYELRALHHALQHDVDALDGIWHRIKSIRPDQDAKLARLKELLGAQLKGRKVLVFTYYKDTARYLYRELTGESNVTWRAAAGNPRIRRMDSGAAPRDRTGLVQAFSPKSNHRPEIAGSDKEIDLMISTDVLSEGQNLQDCGVVLNYDLHWNPTRMVQRAGRIDRIGSEFAQIAIHNMFPDEGLERLLGLVQRLGEKIRAIDRAGFLDASVLGEVVHPRNFNTLRRIRDEDGSVIAEQEEFMELASTEMLQQQLRALLDSGGRETLDGLPDGIHSGLYRSGNKGMFFYFTAIDGASQQKQHFWRYFDAATGQIVDNRFVIANLIACSADTPRVIGDLNPFEVQEQVIQHILGSVQAQAAAEAAPTIIDPVQQNLVALLSGHLTNPSLKRSEVRAAIAALRKPVTTAQVRRLKEIYTGAMSGQPAADVLSAIGSVIHLGDPVSGASNLTTPPLRREDLHLICYDHLVS
jgi:superfamily II DNA or RNA helicase